MSIEPVKEMKKYIGRTITIRIVTPNGKEHLIEDELVCTESNRLIFDSNYLRFDSPHYNIEYVHLDGLGVFDLFLLVIPENLTFKGKRIVEKYKK